MIKKMVSCFLNWYSNYHLADPCFPLTRRKMGAPYLKRRWVWRMDCIIATFKATIKKKNNLFQITKILHLIL